MEFSAGFIMSMISSALFIDGKLDRRLANRRAKTTVFQVFSVQDGKAVASGKGAIFRPV
jgi:hypothetical protein